MKDVLIALFFHECKRYVRKDRDWASALLFYLVLISLYPIAVGPNQQTLQPLIPSIIWIAVLLANVLTLEQLFEQDFRDGLLEQMSLSQYPLALLLLPRLIAHWLYTAGPILLLLPVVGLLFNLPGNIQWALFISLLLGTLCLCLVGGIGVALTTGLKRGGLLLATLVLPLYMPILILGVSVVELASHQMSFAGPVCLLLAYLIVAACFAPLLQAAAIRGMISL